jgi:hypothetical protein
MQLYQLMRAGSHFLIAILLTKIALRTESIGHYEWMLWIGTLLTTFWINALLQAMPFAWSNLPEKDRDAFIRGSFVLFSTLGFVLLSVFLSLSHWLVPSLTGQGQLPGLVWFLLYLCFHVGTYPVEIWYLIKQDGPAIVWWGAATFLLHILALIIPILLTGQLESGLLCAGVLSALRWIFAAWLAFRHQQDLPQFAVAYHRRTHDWAIVYRAPHYQLRCMAFGAKSDG